MQNTPKKYHMMIGTKSYQSVTLLTRIANISPLILSAAQATTLTDSCMNCRLTRMKLDFFFLEIYLRLPKFWYDSLDH